MSRYEEHFRKSAETDNRIAEEHAEVASHHHARARRQDDDDLAKHDKALGNAHERIAKALANRAADTLEMCDKASRDELNKTTPTDIRVTIPSAPSAVERIYGDLTMVPRAGQPPAPQHARVPLEFEHLVKVDEE